ncbi:MAG: hypothetical protein M0Q91_17010 [Methanoregula sp.]|nr:hypothetical protein [Methanoregula sp.]
MTNINWKWILYFLAAVILLISLAAVVVTTAISNEEFERKYGVDVVTAHMGNATGGIEVHQRDTVYWGDTCDLSLVNGWYDKLIHADTGKVVDISAYQYRILIDPETFPEGEWDQWSDFDEEHGNTISFYVAQSRPVGNTTLPEPVPVENTTLIKPITQSMPIKHVSDILIARGDPLNVAFKKAKVWIFGTTAGYYDFMTVDNAIVLNATVVKKFEPGTYYMVVEQPGKDKVEFTMRYVPATETIEYFDATQFKIMTVSLSGLDPRTRLDKFRKVRDLSTDLFTEYKLEVEDPYIEITSLDEQYIDDEHFSKTIKGYTNTKIGTELTFIVDKDRKGTDSYSTFTTTAQGSTNPGDMRYFEITVPLLWDNYGAGHHTVTATTAIGGSMSVDFDVHESPDHSFIPNNTIKYVNGSEWKEPVIIEKTVTVTIVLPTPTAEKIYVNVTPSIETQQQVQYDANVKFAQTAALVIGGVVVVLGLSVYVLWTWKRRRDRIKGDGE